ncbi:hypothetical protein ACYSNW_06035 [Enterococcus sp. LJL99]
MNQGFEALLSDKRTSNNRHLSRAEEPVFLARFLERADEEQIITITQVHQVYQEKMWQNNQKILMNTFLNCS